MRRQRCCCVASYSTTPRNTPAGLNMAEIEIGILDRQCLDRRRHDRDALTAEADTWQQRRNAERRSIEWMFIRQDADQKMQQHYVS
ncbi:hypothetical protein [Nitrosomonas sp. Nm132]|uniref:hypothetical protein n=1 Tax=Nitrosomonas sp. Nm132 TaxID=1881053 RepID=UPI0015A0C59C|nr:hypothetical protein [Nitrosomonas sp. Nm132]